MHANRPVAKLGDTSNTLLYVPNNEQRPYPASYFVEESYQVTVAQPLTNARLQIAQPCFDMTMLLRDAMILLLSLGVSVKDIEHK